MSNKNTKDVNKRPGIYKIINIINNKIYVGSAKNISGRWRTHKWALLRNKHYNRYLQRSVNKYGFISFNFEVLEYCDCDILVEREQYYMDTLNPDYNISPTAKNCLGVKHVNEESNYKRGSWRRGKFGKDSATSVPRYQYKLSGEFIKKWDAGKDIEREFGKVSSNLDKGTSNKLNSVHFGFIWSRKYQGLKIPPMIYKDRSSTCKEIGMYSPSNILVQKFKSQRAAAEYLGIAASSIASCLVGKSKTCAKHIWKYINNEDITNN